MRFFCSILAWGCPLVGYAHHIQTTEIPADGTTVYVGHALKCVVPTYPLASGSVQIMPSPQVKNFLEWQIIQGIEAEAYALIKRIVRVWEKRGITDYMIFGRECQDSHARFNWEVVPYPKGGWNFLQQCKVLWKIAFGASLLPQTQREKEAKELQNALALEDDNKRESIAPPTRGSDVFCNPQVIERQLVFEGKEINVLYNYAPIALDEKKLHFLITPKQHRVRFSDLTETEYVEARQVAQRLVQFYKDRGYTFAYLFNKTGARAGQSVFHWHEHVIFAATKTRALFGKLLVLKKMLLPVWPLSPEELEQRVHLLRRELKDAL